MFIANHFVRINRTVYVRGEAIPDGLSEDAINRMLSVGAIHEIAPAPNTGEPTEEEAEAPEIDVMSGIVEEEPQKPARKRRRKKVESTGTEDEQDA